MVTILESDTSSKVVGKILDALQSNETATRLFAAELAKSRVFTVNNIIIIGERYVTIKRIKD